MKSVLFLSLCLVQVAVAAQIQLGNTFYGSSPSAGLGFVLDMPDDETIVLSDVLFSDESSNLQVYTWDGSIWQPKGSVFSPEEPGVSRIYGLEMPDSSTLLIAEKREGSIVEHVRVFVWDGSNWVQKGQTVSTSEGYFSAKRPVSMPDPNTIAFCLVTGGSDAPHCVTVYDWNGELWLERGSPVCFESHWLHVISMPDALTLSVGFFSTSEVAAVYQWNGDQWISKGEPFVALANGTIIFTSVSMPSADVVAISEARGDYAYNPGSVRVFDWNGVNWVLRGSPIVSDDPYSSTTFGTDVSMPNSNTIAVGDAGHRYNPNGDMVSKYISFGNVRVFQWDETEWMLRSNLYTNDGSSEFGYTICMPDEDHLAVGAPSGGVMGSGLDWEGFIEVHQIDPLSVFSDREEEVLVSVFPNPTQGSVFVEFPTRMSEALVSVFTVDGRRVEQRHVLGSHRVELTLNQPVGLYFVEVVLPNGARKTLRLVKA